MGKGTRPLLEEMVNMDRRIERKKQPAPWADDGRTLQSQAKNCDINLLLARWEKTGTFTHVASQMPTYGDFSNATDYLGAVLQVKEVQRLFHQYPAEIRARFENDPQKLLSFMEDPENHKEAMELGLVPDPVEDRRKAVQPPSPPADSEEAAVTGVADGTVQGGE